MFPFVRKHPFDLPPAYAAIRADEGICPVRLTFDDTKVWIVTRYEEACTVLGDARFSSDFERPGFPRRMTVRPPGPGTFIRMDPPDHTRLRRALTNEFKPKRVESLRPAIQQIVDSLIDGLTELRAPVDLVQMFALPLPSLVVCELLGVHYADRGFFHRCVRTIGMQDVSLEERTAVRERLSSYIDGLVSEREAEPKHDLLSRLAQHRADTGDLSREEVVGIATLLLIAGYETVANMIGIGLAVLLHNRDQLADLRADPGRMPAAVEELLRYQTVIQYGLRRAATADVHIGRTLIRADEGVIVLLDSANRDGSEFTDPDRFDIGRGVGHHLAFGFGVHQCVGQLLARLELEVAWSSLLRRLPGLRLAVPIDEVKFRHEMFVYGVHELPVTW